MSISTANYQFSLNVARAIRPLVRRSTLLLDVARIAEMGSGVSLKRLSGDAKIALIQQARENLLHILDFLNQSSIVGVPVNRSAFDKQHGVVVNPPTNEAEAARFLRTGNSSPYYGLFITRQRFYISSGMLHLSQRYKNNNLANAAAKVKKQLIRREVEIQAKCLPRVSAAPTLPSGKF